MKEVKKRFEEIFEVPDFLDFDGEAYMYYEEDPVLKREAECISDEWRGFRRGYQVAEEINAENIKTQEHETPEQYKQRTGEDYSDGGPVWNRLSRICDWELSEYFAVKGLVQYIIIANEHGKPLNNWRPE